MFACGQPCGPQPTTAENLPWLQSRSAGPDLDTIPLTGWELIRSRARRAGAWLPMP